jgi:hypothetical protein
VWATQTRPLLGEAELGRMAGGGEVRQEWPLPGPGRLTLCQSLPLIALSQVMPLVGGHIGLSPNRCWSR